MLFGMLIISFGLWGVGDMLRAGGRATEIAHVGGTHIPIYGWVGGTSVSVNQVRDQFNLQLDGIQRQTGQRPEPEQALRYGLHVRALEEVVQRAVLDHAIQEFGLVVSDEEVRAAIARNPAFQGTGGSFDPLLYRNRLQQARISEAQYVTEMRREIAANQLFGVGASRWPRAQVAARRHLQDGRREAGRRDALHTRRHHHRRAQAHTRAAQRLFRGQQDQVPDPRVPRLLLRPAERRGHPAPGVGDVRAAQAGVRSPLRRVRHAGEARRRPGDGRHRGQGQGHHRRRRGRQVAGGRGQGGARQRRRRDQARPGHQEGPAARSARRRHLRPAHGRRAGAHPVAARLARRAGQQDRARQGGVVRRGQGQAREGTEGPAGARSADQAGHRLRAHPEQEPVDEGGRRGARPQGQDLRECRCARPGCVGQAGRDRPRRRRAGAGRVQHPRKRRERPPGDAARRIFRRPHRPRHAGPRPRPQRSRGQGHRSLAGRGAAQARRRQGQGRPREGRGRHRPRRHRQGARPGGADRQGGHALRGRSAATISPSRW